MTYVPPTPYVRASRFAQFGSAIPGTTADVELDGVKIATDSLLAALNILQRNDGKLNNGLVTPDSLSQAAALLVAGWNPRGGWLTGTNYAVKDMVEQPAGSGINYVCPVGHTAGVFATDLAAGKWTLVAGAATFGGAVLTSGSTGGIGYSAGAGGQVVQPTSKATGVTLNAACGLITLNGAALASLTSVSFVLTDSAIGVNDYIDIQHDSVGSLGSYWVGATPAAGSVTITVRNVSAGPLSEAIVLRFFVNKAAVS